MVASYSTGLSPKLRNEYPSDTPNQKKSPNEEGRIKAKYIGPALSRKPDLPDIYNQCEGPINDLGRSILLRFEQSDFLFQ